MYPTQKTSKLQGRFWIFVGIISLICIPIFAFLGLLSAYNLASGQAYWSDTSSGIRNTLLSGIIGLIVSISLVLLTPARALPRILLSSLFHNRKLKIITTIILLALIAFTPYALYQQHQVDVSHKPVQRNLIAALDVAQKVYTDKVHTANGKTFANTDVIVQAIAKAGLAMKPTDGNVQDDSQVSVQVAYGGQQLVLVSGAKNDLCFSVVINSALPIFQPYPGTPEGLIANVPTDPGTFYGSWDPTDYTTNPFSRTPCGAATIPTTQTNTIKKPSADWSRKAWKT